MLKLLKPADSAQSYDIAAAEFAKLYEAVTGRSVLVVTQDDGCSDLVVIGGETENAFAMNYILDGGIDTFGVGCGTDDYRILSADLPGRNVLFLVGGSGRSTIYAVYDYFERVMGCRYFWDGDILPAAPEIQLQGMDVLESPRFSYRGLRYFAHRALHRFQAEHWGLDDWKKEIDWMMKKRLNFFMLRIGYDDVWQKAFPELVDYPANDKKLLEGQTGYDDRTTPWSLQFRGQLRKQLLDYAFDRELIHPEDFGTITHWYSTTPPQFLEKAQPTLLPHVATWYDVAPHNRVFDIREKKNFDYYCKLTETHIKEYGRPQMFHTIGLGERNVYPDRARNMALKKLVYRKLSGYLKTHYPNAPLLLATWDLWLQFSPQEVRALLAEMDPARTILMDYTSDTVGDNNFTQWGVVGRFPWFFGIFLGYSRNSDIRTDFSLLEQRLKIAAEDSFCQGLILWPELSHSSTFMTEYLADNAWAPLRMTLEERVEKYCRDRYRFSTAQLTAVWQRFMPIAQLMHWSMGPYYIHNTRELFFVPMSLADDLRANIDFMRGFALEKALQLVPDAASILRQLAQLDDTAMQDPFIRRDVFDIARTVMGRYVHAAMLAAAQRFAAWRKGAPIGPDFYAALAHSRALLRLLGDLMGEHEDYSIYASLQRLATVAPVNPVFEDTLKENSSCDYHRTYAYENIKALYLPGSSSCSNGCRTISPVAIGKLYWTPKAMPGPSRRTPANILPHRWRILPPTPPVCWLTFCKMQRWRSKRCTPCDSRRKPFEKK